MAALSSSVTSFRWSTVYLHSPPSFPTGLMGLMWRVGESCCSLLASPVNESAYGWGSGSFSWWDIAPVHNSSSDQLVLFFNSQQPHSGRIFWESKQGRQLFRVLLLQSSYISIQLSSAPTGVLPPEVVYDKDSRNIQTSHNGVLLPLLPWWSHFGLHYN